MRYEAEMVFFQKILKNAHLDCHLVCKGEKSEIIFDRGLRELVNLKESYQWAFHFLWERIQSNVIYRLTDQFYCSYVFFCLPEIEPKTVMLVGPYTKPDVTRKQLSGQLKREDLPPHIWVQLEKYYGSVPMVMDETQLLSVFHTFGEVIWGGMDRFTVKILDQQFLEEALPSALPQTAVKSEDPLLALRILEERYEKETRMLEAVSQGMMHKVENFINHMSDLFLEERVKDPVRNTKNYMIVMNTLLRKAAQQGGVHPFYIDGISADFARKIENSGSQKECGDLMQDMLRKYCLLVRKQQKKKYSQVIQKTIVLIDTDLSADLGLKRLAEFLNVNTSYLSSLFKKETGETLTEYVTRKRMEKAAQHAAHNESADPEHRPELWDI